MEKLELPQEEVHKSIIKRYFTTLPIFFPLIGLFLLGIAANEFWNYASDDNFSPIYWWRPILFLVYFLFWIPICFAKKWGALGFLILTILGMSFFLFSPNIPVKRAIGDVLVMPIPANVLFSFLVLFYYRRMK